MERFSRKMPQEFQVLQCFRCSTFQVHQVKKAKKWSCKMCGEKQSVIKVYGKGTGIDCRQHVQELNQLRFENETIRESCSSMDHFSSSAMDESEVRSSSNPSESSKWTRFQSDTEKDLFHLEESDEDLTTYKKKLGFNETRTRNKKNVGQFKKHRNSLHQSGSVHKWTDFKDHSSLGGKNSIVSNDFRNTESSEAYSSAYLPHLPESEPKFMGSYNVNEPQNSPAPNTSSKWNRFDESFDDADSSGGNESLIDNAPAKSLKWGKYFPVTAENPAYVLKDSNREKSAEGLLSAKKNCIDRLVSETSVCNDNETPQFSYGWDYEQENSDHQHMSTLKYSNSFSSSCLAEVVGGTKRKFSTFEVDEHNHKDCRKSSKQFNVESENANIVGNVTDARDIHTMPTCASSNDTNLPMKTKQGVNNFRGLFDAGDLDDEDFEL